jgi:hypothetical protein
VAALADQVGDDPMLFTLLDELQGEAQRPAPRGVLLRRFGVDIGDGLLLEAPLRN